METLEDRRIFLVATASPNNAKFYSDLIQKHISSTTVFISDDGPSTVFKMENYPPHVLIVDRSLPKQSGIEIVEASLKKPKFEHTAMVIISDIPDLEHFVDDVVIGRVQFLENPGNEIQFSTCLSRALNFVTKDNLQEYRLHFLTPNEILFKKDEKAKSVYIVKKGEMEAFISDGSNEKILGKILTGEFVGEMAHLNGEPRSATVRAITDCELIEIPIGKLDMVLFTKPAWSKALVQTLSRRLKRSNEKVTKS